LADQELQLEKLASGDRPSIIALGIAGAESLKQTKMAVFMVDVLGRVHVMPPTAVQVTLPARVLESELDAMDEERSLDVMLAQGDDEEAILAYLRGRRGREAGHGDQDL
jgi:hypothetical protein